MNKISSSSISHSMKIIFFAVVALLGFATFCDAQVKISLELPEKISVGEKINATLNVIHEKDWHTYAKGEVGEWSLKWKLPKGWSVGEAVWPQIHEFTLEGITAKVYEGDEKIKIPMTAGESGELELDANWVMCTTGKCVPGGQNLSVKANVTGSLATATTTSKTEPAKNVESASKTFSKMPEQKIAEMSVVKLAFLAMIGGVILNLMPCVFPVLGVKMLSFAKQAGGDRKAVVRDAFFYGAGIVLSALVLAAALLAVRSSGAVVGWGFQLQNPTVVWTALVVLSLLAMNMLGGFELPVIGGNVAGKAHKIGGALGNMLSGALMVVVATPCSAPFLAAAIGGVFLLPAISVFFVLGAMGVGMALPYWILAVFPGLVNKLPKPGAWMEDLKKTLGWVMVLSAVYVGWVYSGLSMDSLKGLMGIGLLLWGVWSVARWSKVGRLWGILIILTGVWLGPVIPTSTTGVNEELNWQPWSVQKVAELSSQGKTVVVDFTARWCVNCLINERVVWENKEVKAFVKKNDIVLLKADWTNPNEKIATELKRLGSSAVPMLLIEKDGQEIKLPGLLSVGEVLSALSTK